MAYNNEPDRRSNVSSFYGGRKSSLDALNAPDLRTEAPQDQRARCDSASSFFGAERGANGGDGFVQSAGYNRQSFFGVGREVPVKGGRDEEEDGGFTSPAHGGPPAAKGWDVFADFNNAGPRYSSAFVKYDEGYQQIPPETPRERPPMNKFETESTTGPVEMVTVPALGAEWKRSELQAMSKKGKKEVRDHERSTNAKRWWRDQRGICGKWGTRKQIVIVLFIACTVVGIVLAFTIPRIPIFAFAAGGPLANSTEGPAPYFSRAPANFTFNLDLDLRVDATASFVPLKFNRLHADVFDLQTKRQVAEGDLDGKGIPGRKFTEILIPLNFTYVASNDSDATWLNWYNACRNKAVYPNGQRPGVGFRVILSMNIAGLIGSRETSAQIPDAGCPFELPQNAA